MNSETKRPRVRASPVSLRCGPWARHIYPTLVLVQSRKTRPCLTVKAGWWDLKNQIKQNKTLNLFYYTCVGLSIHAYRYPLLQISLFLFDIWSESKPSQNPIAGHNRPASETPFGWRFADRPLVPRFYVHPGKLDRDNPILLYVMWLLFNLIFLTPQLLWYWNKFCPNMCLSID